MSTEHKSLKQIINFRLEKLADIRESGFNPYPHNYNKTHTAEEILISYETFEGKSISIAGRIVAMRKMGKASFFHIQDETGKIQMYIKRDNVGTELYNNLFKKLDLGDIVGIEGIVFKTKTEETSINVEQLTLLSKNIRPLPNLKEKDGEAFNAFDDKEHRYRNRHLDLIANPDVKLVFQTRARIITLLRNYLDNKGFVEVETPVLQSIYGGASARPFTTYHNTLDQNLFLRIADELYLKRLIIGGFDKVYEIAKNFRNEGMDKNHNPEYTSLEYYQAYADVHDVLKLTERMIRETAKAIGKLHVKFGKYEIDLSKPFEQKSMAELLKDKTKKDVFSMNREELQKLVKSYNIDVEDKMNYGQLFDKLFGEIVEPDLIQPTFVMDYPKEISPLAKEKRGEDSKIVERFELFIGGMEFANAFTELNDPIEQRKRLEEQAKLRELGDDEAQVVDENFLQAVEYGMPPTGGVGIGVDRLVMLLTEQTSIKDVLLFPAMRPEV
ncbi:MAG: lysine--tRNA ligase [Candidatus Marinimicrobia bacterium]|nr:lysine--tRNA ligase [Candidatus Neomarinimicrobiota bacterium]MBL7022741.1 lysine--tRNA ligase [Candidatus Neomarinimicrobiota bacterium]MBL7109620.1 lysine--tRNA ligase [Candidatus Neomarinimicrobiota bacterium]